MKLCRRFSEPRDSVGIWEPGRTLYAPRNFCVDGYERSLHPQQRYKEGTMVEAGWDNIMHKGAPIVADPYYSDRVSGCFES